MSKIIQCTRFFIGSSPKSLSADGRTDDLEAILHVIKSAQKYIYIAINEYIPMDLWKNQQPWTPIDDELRKAVTQRNIEVKFLVNGRASHKELMLKHLRNLMEVAPLSIQIKIYQVRDKSAGWPDEIHEKMPIHWIKWLKMSTSGSPAANQLTPIFQEKKKKEEDPFAHFGILLLVHSWIFGPTVRKICGCTVGPKLNIWAHCANFGPPIFQEKKDDEFAHFWTQWDQSRSFWAHCARKSSFWPIFGCTVGPKLNIWIWKKRERERKGWWICPFAHFWTQWDQSSIFGPVYFWAHCAKNLGWPWPEEQFETPHQRFALEMHQFVYNFCLQKFVYIGNVNIGRRFHFAEFRHPTSDIGSKIGRAVSIWKLEAVLRPQVTGAVFAPKRPLCHDGKAKQACIHKLPLLGSTGAGLLFLNCPLHPYPSPRQG